MVRFGHRTTRTLYLGFLVSVFFRGVVTASIPDPDQLEFFEKQVRPLLVEHCYECHSAESKKLKGGLYLDSRDGWVKGGDSGPAILPGQLEESLLLEAVRYGNADLEMPPKRKLPDAEIAILEKWVAMGAPDPRQATVASPLSQKGMSLEEGRKFWSYRSPKKSTVPAVKDSSWPRNSIDRFILAKLEAEGLSPAEDADRDTLTRRLCFDLTGLPPTAEALGHDTPFSVTDLVDDLLASPRYGERWGRHWLDVVRFGESVTLRGFVFPEAWRYRDYVIESFNKDVPYPQFLREQIAGDLLPATSVTDAQRQRIATTFLTLGNNNYEEQDKSQLDMDVVDEQIDVIGKAFLAQTIACARCHDHKFDPIPTRDYYALAGILKGMKVLEHANVSKWIEKPMPLSKEEEAQYHARESRIKTLDAQVKEAKEALAARKEPIENASPARPAILSTNSFSGIVLDDSQARRVGEWKLSQYTKHFIGDGYTHDLNEGKGTKTSTFQPTFQEGGRYEVRFAYTAGSNRARQAPVTVFSADGEKTILVDETKAPPIEGRFISLGVYRFEANDQGFVIVSNDGTTGHVTVDAMQFLKVGGASTSSLAARPGPDTSATSSEAERPKQPARVMEEKRLQETIEGLEKELAQVKASGPERPMIMTVQDDPVGDIPIHIRGTVHNLGEIAPRGFLRVAMRGSPREISSDESGRLQLAEWLASPENPLTARVLVNRAWHWLMGDGLVRTMDNFGTTGSVPTHPELLDWLAIRFKEEGWSIKWLVREIVTSRVYGLSSATSPESATLDSREVQDPENRLRWRMSRRRLDAECIRDAMLAVSGELDLTMGGPTYQAGQNADYGQTFDAPRRSVYVPVLRNSLPELFEVFDFADPSMVIGKRNVSTVAPQALYFLNHPFVRQRAQAAARLVLEEFTRDDEGRVSGIYRRALGRPPTLPERKLARQHLRESADSGVPALEAWTELVQALFGSLDFRYLN